MKELDNVKKYWKDALGATSALGPGETAYYHQLLDIAKKSQKILEVGVGTGRMVKVLKHSGVGAEFHGVDITENAYDCCAIGKIGDARNLPYDDDSFDLVYSLGVVEHFPETAKAVAEHARVTKRGGHVLVATPRLSIFTPLRYLLFWFNRDRRGMGTFEEIAGRNIMLSTMVKYFDEAGLKVTSKGMYGLIGNRMILDRLGLMHPDWLSQSVFAGAYLYVIGVKP